MCNILIGVTGSVAAIKIQELFDRFSALGEVRVVSTNAASYFTKNAQFHIYRDVDEWPENYELGDSILHIELRRWADYLIVAPLDANTLAKASLGLCDNLLTCIIRAWDWNKPMFLCPAMNTLMWENTPTKQHIDIMKVRGAYIIGPISKKLACADVGMGAMESPESVFNYVEKTMMSKQLRWKFPLKNCNGIPINHHPGAFGFCRRKNHHTGVDLYTNDGEPVFAVEDGVIVKIDVFTGPKLGHTWWEETWNVMVEGSSGVVNYGEVTPVASLSIGINIKRGDKIANVKRVLFLGKERPDISGHSTSMLHLELYKHGITDAVDWYELKDENLLDPTPFLMTADDSPKVLTWDGATNQEVG